MRCSKSLHRYNKSFLCQEWVLDGGYFKQPDTCVMFWFILLVCFKFGFPKSNSKPPQQLSSLFLHKRMNVLIRNVENSSTNGVPCDKVLDIVDIVDTFSQKRVIEQWDNSSVHNVRIPTLPAKWVQTLCTCL